jgi:hypothetical protein
MTSVSLDIFRPLESPREIYNLRPKLAVERVFPLSRLLISKIKSLAVVP